MKHLVRVFLFNVFALWFTSQAIPGFIMPKGLWMMLVSGFMLSLLMLIVKPVLKILFIPINIVTFGLLSWFVNVIIIYLLTILMPEIRVISWIFNGISFAGFIVPSFEVSYFINLICCSLLITTIVNILHYVSED